MWKAYWSWQNVLALYKYKWVTLKPSVNWYRIILIWYELPHDITNKMICAPSEESDQPGNLPSLVRVFAVRSKCSRGPNVSSCGQRRLWSDWANAQADLRLRWVHRSFCWFCHEAVHMYISANNIDHTEAHLLVTIIEVCRSDIIFSRHLYLALNHWPILSCSWDKSLNELAVIIS